MLPVKNYKYVTRKNKVLSIFLDSYVKIISICTLKEYILFCIENDIGKIKYKTEFHHILPKSLFKEYSNLDINKWNGTNLTFQNHYIAHSMLVEAIDTYEMYSAWRLMNNMNQKSDKIKYPELILGPKKYSELREKSIIKHKEYLLKEYIDENGNLTTIAKEAGKKVQKSLNKEIIDENGNLTTIAQLRALKNSITVKHEFIDENGNISSLAKIRTEISSNSMKKEFIDENGNSTSLAKIRGKNSSGTMKKEFIDENGKLTSIYKESGEKCSKTLNKEFIDENGKLTTIAKERGIKCSIIRRQNGRKFNLYHINLGLITKNVSMAELRDLSQTLYLKTKENYLGKSPTAKTVLLKNYKGLLIGLYVE